MTYSLSMAEFLFHDSDNFVITLSIDYKVIDLNASAQSLINLSKCNLIGQNFFLTCAREGIDLPFNAHILKKIINNPTSCWQTASYSIHYRRNIQWKCLFVAEPSVDLGGYFLLVGKDKNILSFNSQDIIENLPEYIFWKDSNSIYQGCNKNLAEYLGLNSPSEIIGKTDHDFNWDKDSLNEFDRTDKEILSKGVSTVTEKIIMGKDSLRKVVLINKSPLRGSKSGKIIGVLGILTDITVQKELEEKLQIAKNEVEKAANQAKNEFLANVNHDIRTPLVGIISTAECLMDSIQENNYKNRLRSIVDSGYRLLELMNELIEFSNLKFGKTSFKLKQLVYDIVDLVKPAVESKSLGLFVKYDDNIPKLLINYRWYIYRILLNLITNAVKFTDKGKINIEVLLLKESEKVVTIKVIVQDSGIGIPQDKHKHIFDKFSRIISQKEETYKGNGLGLYIVNQFVEAIAGKIYVESKEGEGSTFTVIFPMRKVKPESTHISPLKEHENKIVKNIIPPHNDSWKHTIKILIVEDNAVAANALEEILLSLKCHVDIARTGREAIQLFEYSPYDLIFMDIELPDLSGCEITKAIRKLEQKSKKSALIIGLSAYISNEIKFDSLLGGMNDVLSKPLSRKQAQFILQREFNITNLPASKQKVIKDIS